jgi:hypothetical protein
MAVKGLFDAIAAMQFKLASKLIEGGVDVNIAIAGVTPLMILSLYQFINSKL